MRDSCRYTPTHTPDFLRCLTGEKKFFFKNFHCFLGIAFIYEDSSKLHDRQQTHTKLFLQRRKLSFDQISSGPVLSFHCRDIQGNVNVRFQRESKKSTDFWSGGQYPDWPVFFRILLRDQLGGCASSETSQSREFLQKIWNRMYTSVLEWQTGGQLHFLEYLDNGKIKLDPNLSSRKTIFSSTRQAWCEFATCHVASKNPHI